MIPFIKQRLCAACLVSSSVIQMGCMTTATLPNEQRPKNWGTVINDSQNFYQISSTVFRSEQPNQQIINDLRKHEIDIVINLRSRDQDKIALADNQFKLIHIPIHTWAIDRNDLLQVMREIKNAQNNQQKVLIHCYHGSDRTGASIAMYRIIFENWKTEDALNEMRYGGYGFHPIWINIEKIFNPENIKWIQEQLKDPSLDSKINQKRI